jgi:hypothetical protein
VLRIGAVVLLILFFADVLTWAMANSQRHVTHLTAVYEARTWIASFFKSTLQAHDSWEPMQLAFTWFEDHRPGRMYEQLFFVDQVKFQYPPSSLLPLEALARIGIHPTNTLLNRINFGLVVLNIVTSGMFAYVMAQRSQTYVSMRWSFALLGMIGSLLFYPIMTAFNLGQVQVWINAWFALSALAWLAGREAAAGAMIGLICLIKPQFMLFLVWGLLRRKWRFVAGWAGVAVVGSALAVAVFGVQNHIDYLYVLRALSRSGEAFEANQSFNGLLNRLYATDDPSVWQAHGFPPFNPIVYFGTAATSTLMIGAAMTVPLLQRGGSTLCDFLCAAVTFTIASPVAWEHHYGVLPVVYITVLFLLLEQPAVRHRSWMLAALTLSFCLTGHYFGGSWMFSGALILLGLLYWNRLLPSRAVTIVRSV